jgi:hypothetical protein
MDNCQAGATRKVRSENEQAREYLERKTTGLLRTIGSQAPGYCRRAKTFAAKRSFDLHLFDGPTIRLGQDAGGATFVAVDLPSAMSCPTNSEHEIRSDKLERLAVLV